MPQSDFEEVEVYEVMDASNGPRVLQQERALLDTQIVTAKKYPRNLPRCINNAITIITLDKEIAEKCTYALKKGGNTIAGPSVQLARILAYQMGNMRIENAVLGYDSTHVTSMAMCFDLERNYAVRTTVKKYIGGYSEDLKTTIGNAASAVAFRNAVFAVIDPSVVKKVYEAAKSTMLGDVSDKNKLIARTNLMFEGLKNRYHDQKLTDLEICKAVGRNSIDHITSDDLVLLKGYEESLASGDMFFDTIFRPEEKQGKPQPPNQEEKKEERILQLINAATKTPDLEKHLTLCKTNKLREAYDAKFAELKKDKKS